MRWSLTEISPASTIRASSARRQASGFTRTFVDLTDGRGFGIESTAYVLLTKPSTRTSCASRFYGICRKNKEPTSGLEPLTCSLRVIGHALQGFAEVCKYRIFRACANRRVAYVARSSKKTIESLLPLSSTKSCQPIGAASKRGFLS